MKQKIYTLILTTLLSTVATAQEEKTIKFGTVATYKPWNFINEKGEIDGFDIDVAKEVCALKNLKCEFYQQDWNSLISSLRFGKYDVLAAGLFRTYAREKVMLFSEDYAKPRSQLLIRSDHDLGQVCQSGCETTLDFNNLSDDDKKTLATLHEALRGKTIATYDRSAMFHFASDQFQESEIVGRPNYDVVAQDILDGNVDAGLVNDAFVVMRKQEPQFSAIPVHFNGQQLGKGVGLIFSKKSEDLIPTFNEGIRALKKNGKLTELSMKWFNFDLSAKSE